MEFYLVLISNFCIYIVFCCFPFYSDNARKLIKIYYQKTENRKFFFAKAVERIKFTTSKDY